MAPTLRPIEPGDGPQLLTVLGHPEVARWLRPAGVSGPFTAGECDMLAARYAAHWAAHGFGQWLLVDDDRSPSARGGIQHTIVGGRAEVELDWAVARERWGEGLASSIAASGLARAVEHGIEGVVAFTRTDNAASRRVMEKAGLRLERELEHAGLPHVLYRAR